jgi:hypothetical protein
MEFVNHTPFPAMAFDALDQRDIRFHTVVMRLTFELQADGSLALAPEQTPLVSTDEYYGEVNQSSVKQESDFAPYKPHTDVIIIAHAYAPQQQAKTRFTVGLHVKSEAVEPVLPPQPYGLNPYQAASHAEMEAWRNTCAKIKTAALKNDTVLDKRLVVTGPREWRKRYALTRAASLFTLPAWKLTAPKPVTQVSMRYENAYGGDNKILATERAAKRVKKKDRIPGVVAQTASTQISADRGSELGENGPAIAHTAYAHNTVGSGYAQRWYLNASKRTQLKAPQIEAPNERISKFGKNYMPRGLGVITRAWQSRLPQAGTYDQSWLDHRHPYLPTDFNFSYWNAAPIDQQVVPHLTGNETITLTNLCPADTLGTTQDSAGNTLLKLRLPGHLPFVLVRFEEGPIGELAAKLDTVTIDTTLDPDNLDKKTSVVCVWRATLATQPAVRVLEARMIAARDVPALRQLGQQQATARAKAIAAQATEPTAAQSTSVSTQPDTLNA